MSVEDEVRDVLDRYRETMVEEQGPTILTLEPEDRGRQTLVVGIVHEGLQDALASLIPDVVDAGLLCRAVELVSETWVRGYPEGADPKVDAEESLDEAVLACRIEPGREWLATQVFVRTRDGVRWLGEPEIADEASGPVQRLLRVFIGVCPVCEHRLGHEPGCAAEGLPGEPPWMRDAPHGS